MKQKKSTNQKFAFIPLVQIAPSKYQRATNPKQVENIVKHFDEAKLGTLTVSKRDGKYFIIDGAHRLSALRTLQYTHAVCAILEGLTYEQEALYFAKQGEDKRPLKPIDLFKAGIIAGDEKCLQIVEVLRTNKFKIGFSNKDFRQIGAVKALFTITEDYGVEVLNDTLRLVAQRWADFPKATHGDRLLGVAEFIHRYGADEFNTRFADKLTAIWQEYRQAVRQAQYSTPARVTFCRVLVEFYNKGLAAKSAKRLKWETA